MKRWWPWVAVAVGLLVIGVLGRTADDTGTPLDPRSTGPLGARGLVLLLEEYGASVEIAPVAGGDVAVLLNDDLGEDQSDDLAGWVEDGGTLVVADPLSSFVPALGRSGSGLFTEVPDDELRPSCPGIRAFDRIGSIIVPNPAGYRVPDDAIGCFPVGSNAYVVLATRGSGTVVSLGGGAPLVNDRLTEADNAAFAVALMAPNAGTDVVVLEAGAPGSGSGALTDLLPPRTKTVLWQVGLAIVALVAWRARRLGRPIEEHQPVDLPGSELVLATGNLLQAAGRHAEAAAMLRAHLARNLSGRFGVPADDRDRLRSVLVDRGADPSVVEAALGDHEVRDDAQLVSTARAVDILRRDVLRREAGHV